MNSYFEVVFSGRGWSSLTTIQFVETDPQISFVISPNPVFRELRTRSAGYLSDDQLNAKCRRVQFQTKMAYD
jgi:hypothetical protein